MAGHGGGGRIAAKAWGRALQLRAMLSGGKIDGIVPKSYIPNYSEFYEKRWFASGSRVKPGTVTRIGDKEIPFGRDILFETDGVLTALEICEDMWSPLPPSTLAAMAGAKIIANLSASNELAAKHDYLVSLITSRSAALRAAYLYSSAGTGESTTDVVYSGNAIIAENGTLLRHSQRFTASEMLEWCDVDIEALEHDRVTHVTYADNAADLHLPDYRIVRTATHSVHDNEDFTPHRPLATDPFVPSDAALRRERCREIVNIQAEGLMQRPARHRDEISHRGSLRRIGTPLSLSLWPPRRSGALGLPPRTS